MALIAPIIYLFGSLFTGLNGAHGEQLWAQTETSSYSLNVPLARYTAIDANTGLVINGGVYQYSSLDFYSYSSDSSVSYFYDTGVSSGYVRAYFYDSDYSYMSFVSYNTSAISFSGGNGATYFRIYFYKPVDDVFEFINVDVSGDTLLPVVNDLNFSDYVFGQFFARDNFVAKIGEDAISENPHGFAPFGSLFRWLDLNVLNIGDTQVGLMAYGYLYWCAHVLVFDLVFMIATFFISFLDSCFTKFNRSE